MGHRRLTVSEPADLAIDGAADRRRKRIERLVEEAAADGAAVRIPDLAAALEVSVATIRRDLAALRSAGHEIVTRRGH